MSNENLPGNLPAHLHGRSNVPSPCAGGYAVFNITHDAVAGGETDTQIGAVYLPFACRVMAISASCTSSSGGATRATFQVTDGTNDLLTADTLLVTASSVEVTGASTGLVEAQRTRAKGDRLQVDITTPASEAVVDLNVTITVAVRGHVNADPAND